MPGGQAHYTDEYRAYRSAALSTGSSGTYVQLPLDTQSTLVDQNTLSLSGGDVLVGVTGIVAINYGITCSDALMLSRLKVRVTRSPGEAREAILAEHIHLASATGGDFTISAGGIMADVLDTDTIRIEVASVGAGTVAITPGDASTWASFLVVL